MSSIKQNVQQMSFDTVWTDRAEAVDVRLPRLLSCSHQVRRGSVGGKFAEGEVVNTASGRATTPFPKIDLASERKAGNTLKRVEQWLMQNAIDEARSRGDEFNTAQFEVNLLKPQQADKDAAEEYLFGQQPAVLPKFLKSFVKSQASAA
jgi:hypothetical protein